MEGGPKGKGIVRFRVWHWHDAKQHKPIREGSKSRSRGAQGETSTSAESHAQTLSRQPSWMSRKAASVVNLRA